MSEDYSDQEDEDSENFTIENSYDEKLKREKSIEKEKMYKEHNDIVEENKKMHLENKDKTPKLESDKYTENRSKQPNGFVRFF